MPTTKRAAKKPVASSTTTFVKSNKNPEFELFEKMVDEVRKAVRKEVDFRHSVNDDSDVVLKMVTDKAIKRILRFSKWA